MAIIKVKTGGVDNTTNLGRRNLVINGRFQFWQRGTSITGNSGAAPFLADRFFVQDSTQFTTNISRDTDVPSGQGFIFSQKREWTTAHNLSTAGSYSLTEHKIERNDVNHLMCGTSDAKKVTLSFWVKSSVTGDHSFTMQIFSSNRRSYKTTYNIAAANTWEKKTITIQMDTTSAGAFSNAGNNAGIFLRWGHGAGSQYANSNTDAFETTDTFFVTGSAAPASVTNATWYITGIQLEVGDTATPFEFLREGEELHMCKRYLQYWFYTSVDRIPMGGGWQDVLYKELVPEMRAAPTTTYSNVEMRDNVNTAIAISSTNGTNKTVYFQGATNPNNGGGGTLRFTTSGAYLKFDAEL